MMPKEDRNFIFENATIEELESLYNEFHDKEFSSDCSKTQQHFYMYGGLAVADELEARGQEDRAIFLGMRRDLKEIHEDDLKELFRKMVWSTMKAKGLFSGDFLETGEPVSDAASIIQDFIYFLEIELTRRGINYRDIYEVVSNTQGGRL